MKKNINPNNRNIEDSNSASKNINQESTGTVNEKQIC